MRKYTNLYYWKFNYVIGGFKTMFYSKNHLIRFQKQWRSRFARMWKSIWFIFDSASDFEKTAASEWNLASEARSRVVTSAAAQRKCKTGGLIVSDSIGSHNNVIFCCLWRMPPVCVVCSRAIFTINHFL